MKLAGTRALVTRGAAGIGAAIVRTFEAAGAEVVVADLANAPICVDLRRPGEAERMVGEAVALLGGLDVLVNNAGDTNSRPIPRTRTGGDRSS